MAQSAVNQQWKGKTRGGNFGQKSLAVLIRIFGLRVMYFVMALCIPFYVISAKNERRAIRKYFHKICGYGRFKSEFCTAHNFYLFGKMMLDRLAVMAGYEHKFRFSFEQNEIFMNLINQSSGFVMVSAHVGNFEMASVAFHQNKKKLNSLMFGGESPALQARRERILEANGIHGIPVSNDMSHIFLVKAALDRGEIIGVPGDRILGSQKGIPVTLLGEKTILPMGPYVIAAQSDVPMISVMVMREKMWHYKVFVQEIVCSKEANIRTQAKQLAENYAAELENIVKKYPSQWFNFYDFWQQGQLKK